MIDPNETLGQLAIDHPAATRVFLRRRLDFCCGGRDRLVDACLSAGLDAQDVIAEIHAEQQRDEPPARWEARPLNELIDFIIVRYHEPLRTDLPSLIVAAHKVERVHADKPGCPRGLAALLERIHAEVRDHLEKEERVLFPAIVAGRVGAPLQMPINVMMHEHEDHGRNLQHLQRLTNDYRAPAGACRTWRALYDGLHRMDGELREHIHLENNVLFPRALGV